MKELSKYKGLLIFLGLIVIGLIGLSFGIPYIKKWQEKRKADKAQTPDAVNPKKKLSIDRSNGTAAQTKTATPADPAAILQSGKVDPDRVLKKGSKNNEVVLLQAALNKKLKYYEALKVDGDFGSKTETALYKLMNVKQTTLKQVYAKLFLGKRPEDLLK